MFATKIQSYAQYTQLFLIDTGVLFGLLFSFKLWNINISIVPALFVNNRLNNNRKIETVDTQ
jgi:hypothetical protein